MYAAHLLSLCLLAGPAQGQSLEQIAAEADRQFDSGLQAQTRKDRQAAFARAAQGYEELVRRGVTNADLDATLGNAYYLAGDLPRAIIAYQRGLRLDPNDAAMRKNLTMARQKVAFAPGSNFGRPPADHWPPWLLRPRLEHLELAFVIYGLGWVFVTLWRMTRRRGYVLFSATAFAVLVLVAVGFALELKNEAWERHHPLVVISQDGVLLRKGNGYAYPPRYETPLNRGAEARLRFDRGDWLQVELAGGEIGWVPRAVVVSGEW